MANFQYDPPTGPISGVSFEEQTELAINDLHARVDSAESGIAEADDTANQALTSANEAKEQAGQAQTTADGAVTSIAQTNQNLSETTVTANNAMSRANDAFDLAASSGSQAGQVSVGLSNHLADTNNPHQVTAEQVGAVTPTELNAAVAPLSQQIEKAMGTFTATADAVDLNEEYDGPNKLYLTSAASANLPPDVTVPAWLMVYVTSDGIGVTQRCWDSSAVLLIYERTGLVNNSDPNNPVVTWYPWNTIATPTVVKSVSVETDPDGQPAGTYLVFVMDTESGDETTYLNMSQVSGGGYTSGNGAVNISADNKISLQLDAAKSSGLIVAASGLQTVAALSATDGATDTGVPGVVFPDGSTLDVTAEGMLSANPHNLDILAHAALFGGKLNKSDYSGYPGAGYINVPWAPTLDDNRAMEYTPPSDGMIYFFAIGTTTTSHMNISSGLYMQSLPISYPNRHNGLIFPVSAGAQASIGGYGLTSQAVRFFPAKKVS